MPKHLRHLGIVVSDLEAAVQAFGNFGFVQVERFEKVDSPQVRRIVGIPNGELRIADLRDSEGVKLELLQYIQPPSLGIYPKVNRVGLSHLALQVEDISGLQARQEELGLRFLSAPVPNVAGTLLTVYAILLNEVILELVELTESSASNATTYPPGEDDSCQKAC